MISILMAVHSGHQYFREAFESILAQKHVQWELLVCVNGFPKGCSAWRNICNEITHETNRAWVFDAPSITNKPAALNWLMNWPVASHVAIMDVDDLWDPWKLAYQVRWLEQYPIVGTMGEYFGSASGAIPVKGGEITFDDLLETNHVINSSVVMRSDLAHWDETEGLDDYPMWLKYAHQGIRIWNDYGRPLVKIRCHEDQHFAGRRDNSEEIRAHYRSLPRP